MKHSYSLLFTLTLSILTSCGSGNDSSPDQSGVTDLTVQKYNFSSVSQCDSKVKLKAIYGTDDRVDICSSRIGKREYEMAKSTAMLIEAKNLKAIGRLNGKVIYQLISETLEESFGAPACSNVSFKDEKSPGFCSGFLYNAVNTDKRSVLSAGHCFWDTDKEDVRVIFSINNAGTKIVSNNPQYSSEIFISEDQVFNIANTTIENQDFTIITLDRAVQNATPLQVDTSARPSVNEPLQMMGHPFGLMLKFTEGRVVINEDDDENFGAHISSFGGNSGSPVVNKNTGKVVGVLVSGQDDYNYNYANDCMEQTTFSTNDSGYEGVLKIGQYIY
ncbi:serine protease [Halobacteriovorax sp. HLS]|uniref:trypsin-like serine peptidase n=1 Tax=Halobacteriovorax sp. HLS TaxID=2234000 RepID=UPI000FD72D0C|nr:serine protease [Halobacteriovorax sp. HLS]